MRAPATPRASRDVPGQAVRTLAYWRLDPGQYSGVVSESPLALLASLFGGDIGVATRQWLNKICYLVGVHKVRRDTK